MLRAWRTIKKAARMYSATKKLRLPSPMLDAGNFVQKYMEEQRCLFAAETRKQRVLSCKVEFT
jgi:hypothetical protein